MDRSVGVAGAPRYGRRALLGLAAGLAGAGSASALPPFARAAFAQEDAEPAADALAIGLARARAAQKPLLVIVVPADEGERALRGALWGRLFALSSDAELAELALCEVACVAAGRLADALPAQREALSRAPLAVLVETDAELAGTIVDPALGPAPPAHAVHGRHQGEPDHEARARARVATLRAALAAALAGDPKTLERRAQRVHTLPAPDGRGTLGLPAGEALASALGSPRPRLSDLDRYAAYALHYPAATRAAGVASPPAERVRELLGAAALLRLWETAPPGAQWARDSGYCPPCGMAVVPAWSQDFLRFFPTGD